MSANYQGREHTHQLEERTFGLGFCIRGIFVEITIHFRAPGPHRFYLVLLQVDYQINIR